MRCLNRARHVQRIMGGEIYWDRVYYCFRVMRYDSFSLGRWPDHYQKVSV